MRRLLGLLCVVLCVGAFASGYLLRHLLSPGERIRFANASDGEAVLGFVIRAQERGDTRRACFRLRPGASATYNLDLGSLPHVSFFGSDGKAEYFLEDYLFFPARPENLLLRQESTVSYDGKGLTRAAGPHRHTGTPAERTSVTMDCAFRPDGGQHER